MDVGALRKAELFKYALQIGVPTRYQSKSGHRCRRSMRDLRADCVARQRQGPILPEQLHRGNLKCGMNKKAVMRWAISLGVETRRRGEGGVKNVWRRVQDVWSDCIRLERPPQQSMGAQSLQDAQVSVHSDGPSAIGACLSGNPQLVAVSDSACQSQDAEQLNDVSSAHCSDEVLNNQESAKGQTIVSDRDDRGEIAPVWRGSPGESQSEGMQFPAAIDVETGKVLREDDETADADRSLAQAGSLPGTQDLSPIFDSRCKSIKAGSLRDLESDNSPEQLSSRKEDTKERTFVRDKPVPERTGPRIDVLKRAVALGIETRRGSRTEVMQLAATLGIETRKRNSSGNKVLRGVKEVWKDVVRAQQSLASSIDMTSSRDDNKHTPLTGPKSSEEILLGSQSSLSVTDSSHLAAEAAAKQQTAVQDKDTLRELVPSRREDRADVMRLASSFGVETRKRDQSGKKKGWRGAKHAREDVVGLEKSAQRHTMFSTLEVPIDMPSLAEVSSPGIVDQPQSNGAHLLETGRAEEANNGTPADSPDGLCPKEQKIQEELSEPHEVGMHQAVAHGNEAGQSSDCADDDRLSRDMNTVPVPESVCEAVFLDALKDVVPTDRLRHLMQHCRSEQTCSVAPAQAGLN